MLLLLNDNLFDLSYLLFEKLIDESNIKTKLSEITNVQNGYAFKSSEYIEDNNGTLILRIKNIKNDVKYISQNGIKEYSKFSFKLYDSVIVMVGASIGKSGFITQNVLPSLQNQNMWRFRSNNNLIPGLYVYQIINYINSKVKN